MTTTTMLAGAGVSSPQVSHERAHGTGRRSRQVSPRPVRWRVTSSHAMADQLPGGFFATPATPLDDDETKYACEWDATVAWFATERENRRPGHPHHRPRGANNTHHHLTMPPGTEGAQSQQSPRNDKDTAVFSGGAVGHGGNATPVHRTNAPTLSANAPSARSDGGGGGGGLTEEQRARIQAKREEALAKKRRFQGAKPILSSSPSSVFSFVSPRVFNRVGCDERGATSVEDVHIAV